MHGMYGILKAITTIYLQGSDCLKNETLIQNEIRIELSKHGLILRQNVGTFYTPYGEKIKIGFKGLSDLIYFGNDGLVAFIETKTENGKLRKEQKHFLDTMNERGYVAGVARSVEDALKLIKKTNKKGD